MKALAKVAVRAAAGLAIGLGVALALGAFGVAPGICAVVGLGLILSTLAHISRSREWRDVANRPISRLLD